MLPTLQSGPPPLGGDLAPNDDEDRDGYANLLEYGLATSPLFQDGSGSVLSVTPDHSSVSFRKNKAADDLVLRAEFSTDLVTWESAQEVASEDNGDGSETVTAVPPPPNASVLRRFVRLRALLMK
jgi:hypothetical protein